PLGFWLKTDPWDDKVHQLNAKIYAYMNPRDKMPFEVTPLFFKLQRYDAVAAANAVGAAVAPASASAPPAAPPAPAPDNTAPPATPPANGDPNATPPAGAQPAPAPDNAAPASPPPATAPNPQ
ncbi:MAG: hypothetical protein ABR987_03650, partial [Terracidiphilus sp.]